MTDGQRMVSITLACELAGVSRRTIYNWMHAGLIEFVRTAGGAVRIVESSLWRDGDDPMPRHMRKEQAS